MLFDYMRRRKINIICILEPRFHQAEIKIYSSALQVIKITLTTDTISHSVSLEHEKADY